MKEITPSNFVPVTLFSEPYAKNREEFLKNLGVPCIRKGCTVWQEPRPFCIPDDDGGKL